jgi:cobalt/nickel transport system permease protein
MYEWLLKDENYIPQGDKDTFINKSILALLGVLARIRRQSGCKADIFNVNSAFKVAFTLLLIILLSVSKNLAFVVIANVYLLIILSFLKAEDIINILKASITVAVFTFVILIPSVFWGNYYSIMMITPKVFATVTAVNILSRSTKWNSITSALKAFFIPDIFILVLDITIKYIVMLGEFSLNMPYSLKLRSVGKNKSKHTSLSGIAGTMFLESKEMAEDMYAAMECRGFTGEYHAPKKFTFTFLDFIYIMINAAIIFIFLYFERL